jgi:hypothetical protein
VLLVFFFVPFAFAGSAPPTPAVIVQNTDANPVPVTVVGQQGSVKDKNIVQIFTLSEGSGGGPPPYNGWKVLSGDGTVTDYRDAENPLVVPEGTMLVITDFHSDFSTTGDGYISLEISQGDNRIRIYTISSSSFATESRFVNSVHEAMTTGVIVPAGWQLDPPKSGFLHDPPFQLQGYFTSVE